MRALVVGLGRMGRFHARALRDLGFDVATVDPDPAAGAGYRTVPHVGFDAVCVSVPMAHLAEAAAEWAGFAGRLLIEKPGAVSVREADQLSDVLGAGTAVGYVERFNPVAQDLKGVLGGLPQPARATFRRWNTRPSPDVMLDLRSHDVDLARWLGLTGNVAYDTRAGSPILRRDVTLCSLRVDLTAHNTSPLHAQWRAVLGDGRDVATLADARATLGALETRERVAA